MDKPMFKKILHANDGSEGAFAALERSLFSACEREPAPEMRGCGVEPDSGSLQMEVAQEMLCFGQALLSSSLEP